jgi:hypothetical protein
MVSHVADQDVKVGFRIWPTTHFESDKPGLKSIKKFNFVPQRKHTASML